MARFRWGAQSDYCILSKYWFGQPIDYACRPMCSHPNRYHPTTSLYPAFRLCMQMGSCCCCDRASRCTLAVANTTGHVSSELSTNGYYYFGPSEFGLQTRPWFHLFAALNRIPAISSFQFLIANRAQNDKAKVNEKPSEWFGIKSGGAYCEW